MGVVRNIADGLVNALTGAGTTKDARIYNRYHFMKLDDYAVAAAFDGSWLMRKIITKPASEMFREGRDWQTDKGQIEKLKAEEKRLGLQQKIKQAEILRGLGGAGMVIYVKGDDPTLPIDSATIKPQSIRLRVWHRTRFSLGQPIEDWDSDWFGKPSYFRIGLNSTTGARQIDFHPSRVIVFPGPEAPDTIICPWEETVWGRSMVDVVKEAVDNVHTGENGFAALIRGAWLRRIYVPKLFEKVATLISEGVMSKRMEAFAIGETQFGVSFLDGGDGEGKGAEKIEDRQMVWTGIPDIKASNLAVAAAAASIPATVLLEKSPDGMNATGKSDTDNWTKEIKSRQDLNLRPCLDQIDVALVPSAGVSDVKLTWKFAPLSTPTEAEEATTFKDTGTAITAIQTSGLVPDKALAEGVQNLIIERGWLPGLAEALAKIPEGERFPSDIAETKAALVNPAPDPNANPNPAIPQRRTANDARFMDATPRSLYVQRKLLNTDEFIAWAKDKGFDTTTPADELHCTITFSKMPVDWMKMGSTWEGGDKGELVVQPGGARIVEALGDKGAVVLMFASSSLSYRHEEMVRAGASYDFEEYQPHVTITYAKPDGLDLSKVKPFVGPLKFGPELFSEIVDDWEQTVEEE